MKCDPLNWPITTAVSTVEAAAAAAATTTTTMVTANETTTIMFHLYKTAATHNAAETE